MRKKCLSVFLAGVLAVTALAGCGGGNGGSETTAAAGDNGTAAADNGGSADSDAVFKIGGIGPITGNTAIYGTAVQNGMAQAFDEINAAGGINGYQVEYSFEDDVSDPQNAVTAYNTLKDWGMQMLIGTVTSGACEAVVDETYADNMFQITPSGTSLNSIKNDNAFRMCFSDPAQGSESAKYISENNLGSKIAVIYDSSDTYSTGIYQAFAEEAETLGLEIVAAESFTADTNTDFSVQVQKAQDAGADLVFLPIYYQEASLILAKAQEIGYAPQFFGCDGMDGILTLENFDVSLAEGLMLMTPFSADAEDELTQNFVSAYEEAHGETPNQFAADAYDAAYVIKAAAEQAGITPDMSASDICDAMKTAMTEISYTGLTGKEITWGEDGEPTKAPIVVKVTNGAYEFM
ncbi:MAG TPA: ABC transporter substrate-binding protein [Firmicutes bacterium]|nr:ABC transporter substrate-binding protein [Bacillota bacterium]